MTYECRGTQSAILVAQDADRISFVPPLHRFTEILKFSKV